MRQRFDFKNTDAAIRWSGEAIEMEANSEERVKAVLDVFQTKLVKRGVSLKAIDAGEPRSSGKLYKIVATTKQGISAENAKKVTKLIRDEGPKGVKTQIQGDELRVSSKSRDDLQAVQSLDQGRGLRLRRAVHQLSLNEATVGRLSPGRTHLYDDIDLHAGAAPSLNSKDHAMGFLDNLKDKAEEFGDKAKRGFRSSQGQSFGRGRRRQGSLRRRRGDRRGPADLPGQGRGRARLLTASLDEASQQAPGAVEDATAAAETSAASDSEPLAGPGSDPLDPVGPASDPLDPVDPAVESSIPT